MSIFSKIGDLIAGPFVGLAKDFTSARKIKKEAQAKVILAEAESRAMKLKAQGELALKQAEHEANWEITQAQQAATSWKDEYLTVLITVPMAITFFLPVLAAFVGTDQLVLRVENSIKEGWQLLSEAPQWYQFLVAGAFAATFGLRGLAKFWK